MLPILDAGTGHYGILKRLELWNFLLPWVIVGFLGLESSELGRQFCSPATWLTELAENYWGRKPQRKAVRSDNLGKSSLPAK
jgi:hypothetical protein